MFSCKVHTFSLLKTPVFHSKSLICSIYKLRYFSTSFTYFISMSLFLFLGSPSVSTITSSHPSKLITQRNTISCTITHARDKIIDFGKHKGRMLGTLPSKYLKWVSKNLRARDFEEWAKLADEVLLDPVYKDRLEWEFAENLLTGDHGSSSSTRNESTVEELVEFSERFGWDNEDKIGWSRVDFSLLGTSKGGRIPRRNFSKSGEFESLGEKKKNKLGGVVNEGGEVGSVRGKREERIERQRIQKRGGKMDSLEEKKNVGNQEEVMVNKVYNPFPGRESLIKKVISGRRVL